MIKELIHDPIFLAGKSDIATKEDLQVAQDSLDTLIAHKDSCVGMAANMIGVKKRIIAFLDESGRAPAASTPQTTRATNCATHGYLLIFPFPYGIGTNCGQAQIPCFRG